MLRHKLKRLKRNSYWGPLAIAGFQFALLGIFLALFFMWLAPDAPEGELQADDTAAKPEAVFPAVELEARSAYVYDVREDKALFGKDPDLQWPLASLTKLMTAYVASSLIPEHLLVRIEPEDVREEGDTGLRPGEVWNVRKLIDYSLVISSNDGMHAIASTAGSQISTSTGAVPKDLFIERMNKVARDLGLRNTYFMNQSGLDLSAELSGSYGSARDTARLMAHILREDPHLLEATTFDKINIGSKQYFHYAENTNKAILAIPSLIGSKTGFTDLSGGNVVVAWNAGIDRPIVIAVLGSSYDGRFTDLTKLVDATLEYLSAGQGVTEKAPE